MSLASIKKPGRKDYQFVRGDSFQRTLTVKVGGSAFDLTDWDADADIYDSFPIDAKSDPIASFTTEILAPATDGKIQIVLTTTQTAALPGKAGWRLRVMLTADPTSNTHTLLEGVLSECDRE